MPAGRTGDEDLPRREQGPELDVSEADKVLMLEGNAKRLLKL